MKKFIILITTCLALVTPVKAGVEYEGRWSALQRRSQDTLNGLQCLAWLPSQNGSCGIVSSRKAVCNMKFFGSTLPYQVQGGGSGDIWNGYITINGQAIGTMTYNTRFSPYRTDDWSLVVQQFTYRMLDGSVSTCEVRQYSQAFWAFLDQN